MIDDVQRQLDLVSQKLEKIYEELARGVHPRELDLQVWNCYSVLEAAMAKLRLSLKLEEPGRRDPRPVPTLEFANLVQGALAGTVESQLFLRKGLFREALGRGREGKAYLREFVIKSRRARTQGSEAN